MLARLIFALLLTSTSPLAQSEEWERIYIGDYISEHNEALPEFIPRLGRVLYQYTKETGHEACGIIGVNDAGQFGVSLYSDGAQRGCTMRWKEVPDGFISTGETIHSHPIISTIKLTSRDIAWNRAHGDYIHSRTMVIKPGFSKNDLRAGPGWLIDGMDTHYHNGASLRGRRMGIIASSEMAPPALPN